MIDLDIRNSLTAITNMSPYAISLPANQKEGISYNCISDPYLDVGLVKPSIIIARFQISIYLINNYSLLLELDNKIWNEWRSLKHDFLGDTYIEYVDRGSFVRGKELLVDNSYVYSLIRDYIFYYQER